MKIYIKVMKDKEMSFNLDFSSRYVKDLDIFTYLSEQNSPIAKLSIYKTERSYKIILVINQNGNQDLIKDFLKDVRKSFKKKTKGDTISLYENLMLGVTNRSPIYNRHLKYLR